VYHPKKDLHDGIHNNSLQLSEEPYTNIERVCWQIGGKTEASCWWEDTSTNEERIIHVDCFCCSQGDAYEYTI